MKTLQAKLSNKKNNFVPYIMAGDHERGLEGLNETIQLLEQAGSSAIEIGVPFSDPVADGPVIEQAGLRALAKNVSLSKILDSLKSIETEVPLVIMTYFNPVYQFGIENFVAALENTAVKGLIIPDLPKEHEAYIKPFITDKDICLVPLVSLTTPISRQKELVVDAEGFIYAVAINGVTGKENAYSNQLDHHLETLSKLTDIPVLTGFGISTLTDVERFNKVSAGVIVGSKIVRDLHQNKESDVIKFIENAINF